MELEEGDSHLADELGWAQILLLDPSDELGDFAFATVYPADDKLGAAPNQTQYPIILALPIEREPKGPTLHPGYLLQQLAHQILTILPQPHRIRVKIPRHPKLLPRLKDGRLLRRLLHFLTRQESSRQKIHNHFHVAGPYEIDVLADCVGDLFYFYLEEFGVGFVEEGG